MGSASVVWLQYDVEHADSMVITFLVLILAPRYWFKVYRGKVSFACPRDSGLRRPVSQLPKWVPDDVSYSMQAVHRCILFLSSACAHFTFIAEFHQSYDA